MASLGFNILAMQEDLMTSLLKNKKQQRDDAYIKDVLNMLTMFDVFSIQVVFALLDLNNHLESSKEGLNPFADELKPLEIIRALNSAQLKNFCLEQLRLEAPDLDVLSKVIHLYSFCIVSEDLMHESNGEKEQDILQAMIQFCYNDDVRVRKSLIRVFEEALKGEKH